MTLVRYGLGANGLGWSLVQVVLVVLAWIDLREHRLPNAIVVPVGCAAILLRLAFERSVLLEILVCGGAAFAVFLCMALVGAGMGMGDVKLSAAEGLLLGRAAVAALLLGILIGGVAAAALLITRRAERRTAFAYGPYLASGAAMTVCLGSPPLLF